MAPKALIFLIISFFLIPANTHLQEEPNEEGLISVVIFQKGLDFAKDILINQAISSLTPMELPQIQKTIKIPIIGSVYVVLSNITLNHIDVPSSLSYVKPGDTGISIVASGATANLSLNWHYSYSSWVIVPVEISDKGHAFVQVDGMEVELTLGLVNQEGTLKMSLVECGCNVNDISITLVGGASWFYQGIHSNYHFCTGSPKKNSRFVDAFEGQIKSTVESTIIKKIKDGIPKLDSLLQTIPKEISVDDIAFLNVTFVNEPLLGNSSVGLEINGSFISTDERVVPKYYHESKQASVSRKDLSKMLEISIDESVFNSGSNVYFNADLMHWVVDKVPDQSLLNTAGWKYVVPQLYKTYPNDEMRLNISVSSPPVIRISSDKIGATIYLDMTIDVLDDNRILQVACISVDARASGYAVILRNNLAGSVSLDDFTLTLKWSKIGKLHMSLIQVLSQFCKLFYTVGDIDMNALQNWFFALHNLIPEINDTLSTLFLSFENTDILYNDSRIGICSDVFFS
ncbi:hypothetical protein GIB67_032805 [Kingdonia uniflora]|uniref:BPI/LBP family protein n=1 Tax=Kingdonia uniflora TaxID=39325 RepID=A0A7J7MWW6_9MAGN|nr:hypothetical protein GIB67_032805 [Kingdonia uniflora]